MNATEPLDRPSLPHSGLGRAPHNRLSEQGLLGAVLLDNRHLHQVSERIRPEHFYEPVHARIYEQILKAYNENRSVDARLLAHLFELDPALGDVGGSDYLQQLEIEGNAVYDVTDYANQVYELHLRRILMGVGQQLVSQAQRLDDGLPPLEQIEQAEQSLYQIAESGSIDRGALPLRDAVTQAVERIDRAKKTKGSISGLTTGFTDMDELFGGLQNSDLMIIAARPGMGKTALATNIAYNAARLADAKVLFFALEMSAEQLAMRLLAEICQIPAEQLRKGRIDGRDFGRVMDATEVLERLNLMIDDTPALSVASLRARARRLKRSQGGLDLIVVDYLQLMQGSRGSASEGRVQEISEISRGLKSIAKELDVPLVALSQLSRAVEARDDKRPQLSDLRESGSIEQDADEVVFIYRQAYYEKKPEQKADESIEKFEERYEKWQALMERISHRADLIIGKNRHGPTRDITMHFEGRFTKFTNAASDEDYS